MIITPMGAERHYTMSYGEFHARLDEDPNFARWFVDLLEEAESLVTGPTWLGEAAFPTGRWTRVFLLQQLLVELMDVLDPDCVRLSISNRQRLMPTKWGPLPNVSSYQARLQELGRAADFGEHLSALEGLRDLAKGVIVEEEQPPASSLGGFVRNISNSNNNKSSKSKSKSKSKSAVLVGSHGQDKDMEIRDPWSAWGENSDTE